MTSQPPPPSFLAEQSSTRGPKGRKELVIDGVLDPPVGREGDSP
jgi:hypothetical protein